MDIQLKIRQKKKVLYYVSQNKTSKNKREKEDSSRSLYLDELQFSL